MKAVSPRLPRSVPVGQVRQTLMKVRRFRLDFLFGMLLLLFAALIGRLAKLQLVDGAQWKAEAARQQHGSVRLRATRGRILDRNGVTLATSRPSRGLGVDVREVVEPRTFALGLSDFLGGTLSPAQIAGGLRDAFLSAEKHDRAPSRYWTLIHRTTDPVLVDRLDLLADLSRRRLEALGLYGAVVDVGEGRAYPNGSHAAHILGMMPRDLPGGQRRGTGMEHTLDPVLSGQDTRLRVATDRLGRARVMPGALDRSRVAGADVHLTLDIVVQHALETALDRLTARWDPTSAAGVVLDPHTGEVIAMASRPTFDPNSQTPTADHAVQGLYEPGSIFKVFTVAWALEAGVVGADEVLEMPTEVRLAGDPHPIRESHPIGPGTVRLLIQESSNTAAAALAHELGPKGMQALFEHVFGMWSEGTDCGLPFESGPRPPSDGWIWNATHRAGYGQGFAVTPLQLAAAFCAFARPDGSIVCPTLIRDVPSRGCRPVALASRSSLDVVRAGLVDCSELGTAAGDLAACAWSSGSKTGTAQVRRSEGGQLRLFNNCGLIAMAPAEKPQMVVLILAQVPHEKEGSGARVAGPAVRHVIERTLEYWNVPRRDGSTGLSLRASGPTADLTTDRGVR